MEKFGYLKQHTCGVLTVLSKRHNICADGCAFPGNIILSDVLGRGDGCESADEGNLLEKHIGD
jgi:hypothetical protein